MRRLLLIAVVLLVAAACGSPADDLEGTSWRVTSVGPMQAVPGYQSVLRFEDGQMAGNTGCNLVSSSYTLDGETLTVSPMATTLAACADAAAQAFEDLLLLTLQGQTTVEKSDGGLALVGSSNVRIVLA